MSDVWSERAELYRDSAAHKEGPDLDLLVEWVEEAGAKTALDVATGGGHVARRLREAGVQVVTTDAAPGMQPDVVARGEDLPFADGCFDAVVSRVAHHHFDDPAASVREMARVSGGLVVVVDNLFMSDEAEQADKLRDPSHVRNYTEDEWRGMFESAGLDVDDVRRFDKPIELQPWLDRVGCEGDDAERVRELLADRIEDGWVALDRIAIKGTKR
ncbi:MAG TPA: class I SAM-dependent methyltransferase [Gaiellaceae bacterium]|jgi:SAM-dependent methyltransferase|nr:class I SAM-dependent methyltransferase [Gaiellaceae bacterium]